ncbi:MAG: hypothetical protein R6U04_12300 [Bacteroidales bacterium]
MHRNYKIKSQKTLYGNILFRSILEARWAVFFDSMGIEYRYEPHCFDVETGGREVKYRPDFLLPELDIYIEIKPSKPYDIENIKAAAWSKYMGDTMILFNLNPPRENFENGWKFTCDNQDKPPLLSKKYNWCECPKCGSVDISELGQITSCGCYTIKDFNKMYETEVEKGIVISPNFEKTSRLLSAYKRSNKYSFKKNRNDRVTKLSFQLDLF